MKYLVLKWEDINEYGRSIHKSNLKTLIKDIIAARLIMGKSAENEYIVINKDEPYIEEVIDILRKHGHWEG